MRFGIRKNRNIHPLAARVSRPMAHVAREDDEWNIFRYAGAPGEPGRAEREGSDSPMTAPTPPPVMPFPNGFRAQLTGHDMRAERLVRDVRTELTDLRQAFDALGQARADMAELDLEAVAANPSAAATLPPETLVQALAKIKHLEREIGVHEREEHALRDRLASLQDDYAYTRGRLETLHEVIAALHGNLEDFRYDRERRRVMEPPDQRALRSGADDEAFGLHGQRGAGGVR
jgi:hypothetical protein